jgi:SAM-dependent methyltransferase
MTPGQGAGRVPDAEAQARALGTRLFLGGLAAAELMTVYLGVSLGLYQALGTGPATPDQLAGRAGIAGRYAQEWLEQQAVAGLVEVDDPAAEPGQRRYRLPEGHRQALAEAASPACLAPLTVLPVGGIAPALPRLAEAMRSGAGVPYDGYGEPLRAAQSGLNRPVFEQQLAGWIRTALPDVHQALRRPGAAIADVGCGTGTAALVLARTYPGAQVRGFDRDPAAVAAARAGVPAAAAGRVRFEVRDLAGPVPAPDGAGPDGYDLVCVLDALHDLAQPVAVLRACAGMRKPGGAVLLMEPRAEERFTAPGSDTERFLYAVSVLHCLPVGLAEQPSAGTGAVLRPATVRRFAAAAGFGRTTVLDVAHRFHRLYRLD